MGLVDFVLGWVGCWCVVCLFLGLICCVVCFGVCGFVWFSLFVCCVWFCVFVGWCCYFGVWVWCRYSLCDVTI